MTTATATDKTAAYAKLETYLLDLTAEQLKLTAEMYGVEVMERRSVLVNVQRTKAELVSVIIKAEEEKMGLHLSAFGVESIEGMNLAELKIAARRLGVSLVRKTWRDRLVVKRSATLIYQLMYETAIVDIF